MDYGRTRMNEFRKDAVRIALISGLMHKQITGDFGVDILTPNKWSTHCPAMHIYMFERGNTDVVSKRI